MQNYVTVEEKAAEWDVTPRHIQNLCRGGKIDGAIKRVGAWFIPADTPIPLKNTKHNAPPFSYNGTKKRVFDSAIDLFVQKSFEAVKVREIADRAGIRQSTVYNHYRSKQEILEDIYDYYCHFYMQNRPPFEELEPIIQSGNIMDIFMALRYEFAEEHVLKLSHITKIVFQRISTDQRAQGIVKSLMVDEGLGYVEAVFNKAIEMGKLAPCDTYTLAVFVNSIRVFTLHNWLINQSSEKMAKLEESEFALYKRAAEILGSL